MPLMSRVFRYLSICLAGFLAQGITPALSQIVIGASYPQTGAYAALGEPVRIETEIAANFWNIEIDKNSRGTLLKNNQKLVVASKDDGCEPSQAHAAANSFVSPRAQVQVVIGHNCSGAAIEAAPVYNRGGLLMISTFATNPRLTDAGHELVFRMVGRDDDQADAAASYITSKREFGTIAIVHDNQPYGRELANLVRSSLLVRGITVSMFVEVQPPIDEDDPELYVDLINEMVNKRTGVSSRPGRCFSAAVA